MRKEDVASDLSKLAFDFFYWFSRFEFALKENGYLKSRQAGAKADAGWADFVGKWESQFSISPGAKVLLDFPPEQQIVLVGAKLDWRPVGLSDLKTDLARVVRLVKTVRNNLFHGGKHGGKGWDDPKRTEELLLAAKAVLDQLSELASIEADYRQYY